MEINNKPHETGSPRRLISEAPTESARPSRPGADEVLVSGGGEPRAPTTRKLDSVEISDRSRLLAQTQSTESDRVDTDQVHSERLGALRSAYESGELNTPQRIEQAARRMLGGN